MRFLDGHRSLLAFVTTTLFTASLVLGAVVHFDHRAGGSSTTATTSPFSDVSTTTTSTTTPFDTGTTVTTPPPSIVSTPGPVPPAKNKPTATTAPKAATSTTAPAGGVAMSNNTAPCSSATSQPAAGAAVPATGVSTVVVSSGAASAISATGRQPSWRPGAAQVLRIESAPSRDPGLCLSDPSGGNPKAVVTPVGADGAVLSPDGTQLAVRVGVGSQKVSLMVGPVDTPSRRSILDGTDVSGLNWLGNGSVAACYTPPGGSARLVRVAIGGGAPVVIRDSCTGPATGSPDGSRVAIINSASLDVVENTGRVTTLARTGLLPQPPAWSPDGNLIAYTYSDENGRALGVYDLAQNIAKGIVRGEANQPAFSPKGDRILYTGTTSSGSARQILSVPPAGGSVTAIATCAALCLLPRAAWSADATAVAVESTRPAM